MAMMHEWEARVRRIETEINRLADVVARLVDQVGQAQQDQRMQRQPPGFGGAARTILRAVVTTAIPAAPDANSVSNAGRAKLRERNGTALTDGRTGLVVLSDFSVEVAVGTRILLAKDGDEYTLVAADCP
jgi:hypothetical protein